MKAMYVRVKKELVYEQANGDVNESLTFRIGETYYMWSDNEDVGAGYTSLNIGTNKIYMLAEELEGFVEELMSEYFEEIQKMTEQDFREIFGADNDTMDHVMLDLQDGYYADLFQVACDRMLESELDVRGLELNEEELNSESVIEYILSVRTLTDTNYTLEDWIKDTRANYPESFK